MMKSFRFYFPCFLLLVSSFLLSGCDTVTLHALGSNPIPVLHEPRTEKTDSSEIALSANLNGSVSTTGINIKEYSSIGGHLDVTYRLGNLFSPLFFNGTIFGSYGKLKLTCDESDCNEDFRSLTEEEKFYSNASIQERIRVGVELMPFFLTIGASAGLHFYQDFLQYEDIRKELKRTNYVSGNYSYDVYPEIRVWVGSRLGPRGKYGTINLEGSYQLDADYYDNIISLSLGYFHPSGWHGGVIIHNSMILTAGKSFKF